MQKDSPQAKISLKVVGGLLFFDSPCTHNFVKYWTILKILSTVIISRKFAMQHSLNIPPHLKRGTTLPCEMFMSENSLLISEIHLIISLHFSFVKKQRTETSKMIVCYVKVISFCFNIKYSMVFIKYMLR